MKLGLDMRIEQTQKLVMTPELIQAIKLLQLTTQDLGTYIQEQILTNPMLEPSPAQPEPSHEFDDFDRHTHGEEHAKSDEHLTDWTEQIERLKESGNYDISYRNWETRQDENKYGFENYSVYNVTLNEYLRSQLRMQRLSKTDSKIALYMIEAIDERGYLTVSVSEVARLFGATEEEVLDILSILQTFEPAGIAARDLSECLRIQLVALGVYDSNYERIIEEFMEAIADNKLSWVARQLDISLKELQTMSDVIKTLEPKPGRQFASSGQTKYIVPDLILEKFNGEYIVSLNDNGVPQLRINSYYKSLVTRSKDDKQLEDYLKEKLSSAMWLIRSIEQRNQTIINIASAIITHQKEFFDGGEKYLKPLTLKQIAAETNVHESTVSRCVNGKYLQARGGVYELKFFFTGGISATSGVAVASHNVKKLIKDLITTEDNKHPYSDQDICELLAKKGIEISRRTVAKYRDEMNILSSSKRKRF